MENTESLPDLLETAEILAAASAVLGTELSDPVDLGGSHRSTG
jgi:hypothetical protein